MASAFGTITSHIVCHLLCRYVYLVHTQFNVLHMYLLEPCHYGYMAITYVSLVYQIELLEWDMCVCAVCIGS